MKRLIRIFYSALLTCAFAITSCTYEREFTSSTDPEEGMSDITFLVDVPQTTQVATKGSTGSVLENKINDIYVLVFENTSEGKLVSKSKGKNLVFGGTNDNQVSFKATLPVGTPYVFMVLANAESKLADINVGASTPVVKADVMALTVEETGSWSATSPSIPMWGEQILTLTASMTPTFELTRMLARVNVEVNLKEITPGVTKENFKLTSVRYYNYNTAGAIVPDNYNQSLKSVTTPTIPLAPGTKKGEALVYDGTDIKDNESCKEKIYIFEAKHNDNTYYEPANNSDWIDNPCLVVGGQYKTEDGTWLEETFYRVDFIRKDATDPNNVKDVWLSVLRNYSYNVVITEVSGSGFEDPDIAVKSAPINMEANVLEWNESDMGEIVFDGVFYLSVSQDEFIFERGAVNDKRDEYTLYVKTDYLYDNNKEHVKSGWKVEKYVDFDDPTQEVTWLKLNPESGKPDERITAYFTFEQNPLNVNRKAIVWISAGRLRYPVYITQRILSLYIVDPEDNDAPVSEMLFEVPRNLASQASRKFKVDWTPINQPVKITWDSPQVWNPFAPEWLDPDPQVTLGWTISTGTGSQTFEVNPPAVSASDITLDPFYEKETTYTFTVESGTGLDYDSETKSINLHQIYYNIIVDTYAYRLDAKTYTLSVRSNTDWVITNIEEWLYNQDPDQNPYPDPVMLDLRNYDNLRVGTTGGPDVNGTSVAFTVVDQSTTTHKGKWGTVYVTFENPDGKFDPVRVALRFPPDKLKIMGLGYTAGVRAFTVGMPSPYHNNGAYNLLNAQINFGESAESKIYVRAMEVVGHFAAGYSVANSSFGTTWDTNDFKSWLNENPDILVISYSIILNEEQSKLVSDYIDNGGAVIALVGGYNDETGRTHGTSRGAQMFLRTVLEDASITTHKISSTATESDVYLFPVGDVWKNHPMLDGPFGDVRGKHWGAHERSIGFKTSNQATYDQIEIINWSQDNVYPIYDGNTSNPYPTSAKDHVVAFRHKTKNLIWIGCDTFMTGYERGRDAGPKWDPFMLDDEFRPAVRSGFGRLAASYQKYDVYNSYATANMLAWAISVTNHMPPVGGY